VLLREGFSYVFRLEDDGSGATRVRQIKVTTGRRQGERVEIIEGLPDDARVVESGVGFLADGDAVQLLSASASAPSAR